jgi:hypothetical protein
MRVLFLCYRAASTSRYRAAPNAFTVAQIAACVHVVYRWPAPAQELALRYGWRKNHPYRNVYRAVERLLHITRQSSPPQAAAIELVIRIAQLSAIRDDLLIRKHKRKQRY